MNEPESNRKPELSKPENKKTKRTGKPPQKTPNTPVMNIEDVKEMRSAANVIKIHILEQNPETMSMSNNYTQIQHRDTLTSTSTKKRLQKHSEKDFDPNYACESTENDLLNEICNEFLKEHSTKVYDDEEGFNEEVVEVLNDWVKQAGYEENMMVSNGFKECNKFNTIKCRKCSKFKISNSFVKIDKENETMDRGATKIKFDRMLHGRFHDEKISHKPVLQ